MPTRRTYAGGKHAPGSRPGAQRRFASRHPSIGNEILASLPAEELRRLRPLLHHIPLRGGETLCEPNRGIDWVYFPNSGMVSMVAMMREGSSVEVGLTGREGFVGIPVLLGVPATPIRALVQLPGNALRIEAGALRQVLAATPRLEERLRRFACAQSVQVAQAAACNRLHPVNERLCRWLLMSRDRSDSDLLPLTQEFLAQMLGCRRSSVTAATGRLESSGMIGCRRGLVRILNRKKLEAAACECYGVMRGVSGPGRSA